MKQTILISLLAIATSASAQLTAEVGFAPLTSRLTQAAMVSAVYRMDAVEVSLPATIEFGHNITAGITAGYRFPGTHLQSQPNEGWLLVAGGGYTFHHANALKSGEGIANGITPIFGIRRSYETRGTSAVIAELRYQGGAIMALAAFRF
jgi:hypothetical protein